MYKLVREKNMFNLGNWLLGSCDRCGQKGREFKGSIFNTQVICPHCLEKERNHPLYRKALETERAECLKGNLNFEGIGLPDDLK